MEIFSALNNEEIKRQVAVFIDKVERINIDENDRRLSEEFIRQWELACSRYSNYFFDDSAIVMKTLDLHILRAPQGSTVVPLPAFISQGATVVPASIAQGVTAVPLQASISHGSTIVPLPAFVCQGESDRRMRSRVTSVW
ncbi:uncharacterized protein LOC128206133 isoform X2 [Mya arenaria]|nr:uncharacterized protein LOC128206086 isoform X2 [Mya arenaria]XP_052764358.1 uncharacterized protein LOC128206133 isoform X2 [Mya arenaria]